MRDSAPSAPVGRKGSRNSTSAYASYVFFVMFSINLLNYMDRYIFTGAANTIAKELNFGIDGIGVIASAFLVIYTLGSLPLGFWADRAKRKDVIAISVALWSIATTFTALVGNFTTLFISRMLLGIGEAGYYPAGTALLSDYFNRARRARIMSWWTVGAFIGLLIGFVFGGVFAGLAVGSWRLAFLFAGLPGLVLAFLAWRLHEPRRSQADDEAQELTPSSSTNTFEAAETNLRISPPNVVSRFGILLRIKTLVVLIVMQLFAFFVLGVNTVFLPTYLQQKDTFGLSPGIAGIFSGGVIVIAGVIGVIIGGYLSDVLNRRYPGARVLVCGIGFLLGAPAFVLAITTHTFALFGIFTAITVLLVNFYNGPCAAATQDVVPSSLRASAIALSLLLAHLFGDTLAPTLLGMLATSFDPTHGQHFLHGMAGQDLGEALLLMCSPALVIAGLAGILGSRWMKNDIAAAMHADTLRNR